MKYKIWYLLLAVVLALGLWLYVMTTEDPDWSETYYNIPVVLENENVLRERGLMIVSGKQPTVTLKLTGSRSKLSKLNASNITLLADLSRIYEEGEHTLSYEILYPGDVQSSNITVDSQNPPQISISVMKWETKTVPVVPYYTGSVPEGFMTDKDNVTLNHETITITGPAAVLRQITQARVHVPLADRTQTIMENFSFTLCDEAGVPVDSTQVDTNGITQVKLTLKIQRFKEIWLKFNIIGGGGATADNSQVEFDLQRITVSGSEQLLENLEYLDFGDINLADYMSAVTTITYSIQDKLPEGVTNLSGKDKVTVTIRLPELTTATFQVTQFVATHVPEGMQVTFLTQELTVTIRGLPEQMAALTAESLTAVVDFTGGELGTDTYKTTIVVAEEFEGVGAIRFESVSATLSAQENTPEEP